MCRTTIIAVLAILIAAAPSGASNPVDFTFRAPSGNTHQARLTLARAENAVGATAILVGGGGVTDMHWTVPGIYTDSDGTEQLLTIDGESTRDADTITRALLDAGLHVFQWSSIHRDDPLHKQDPATAAYIDFWYSAELTQTAVDALRARTEIDPDRLVFVGHSLGAPRITNCADPAYTEAMVFLAGAYTTRFGHSPSRMCKREFGDDTGARDIDGDGALSDWEVAGAHVARSSEGISETDFFRKRVPWAIDVMRSTDIPTLALYAGEDSLSIHAPILLAEQMKGEDLSNVTVEVLPGLDHNFSNSKGDLIGPIDTSAVNRVVEFLLATIRVPE